MAESESARAAYLRAVVAALGDEVASGAPVTLTSHVAPDGTLDIMFLLPDATAFNACVSRQAEGFLAGAVGAD